MILNEFDQIVKEYLDMTDRPTRQYIIALEDAEQEQLLAALSARLYDNIVAKVDDIDFGTIPRSRGDITKVEKFEMTTESLDIIRRLVLEYKENTSQVDTILTAISNVKDNKGLFMKGYALNVELPMVMYNLIVLSIIRATSMIIATCVKYVADPSTKSMKMAFDKVAYKDTESDVLYQQLVSFNVMCKDGTLVKLLNSVITNNKSFREDIDFSQIDNYGDSDATAQPADMGNGIEDIDSPIAGAEPYRNDAVPTPAANEDDEINTEPAPNSQDVPGTDMAVQQPAEELPDNDDVLAGDASEIEAPQDDIPATEPTDSVSQQPVIPERMSTSGTVLPGMNEEVEKNIETDSTFEKELSGAKEFPVDDKDDNKVRDGAEVYNSSNTEGEKQEVVGTAQENSENLDESKLEPFLRKAGDLIKGDWKNATVIGKAARVAGVIVLAYNLGRAIYQFTIGTIIPWCRNTIYTFYYSMMKISDYFQIQAELIQANADELESTTADDDEKKKKVIQKQRKWADTFKKWSNMFNIDRKQAEKKAQDEAKRQPKSKVGKNDEGDDILF